MPALSTRALASDAMCESVQVHVKQFIAVFSAGKANLQIFLAQWWLGAQKTAAGLKADCGGCFCTASHA